MERVPCCVMASCESEREVEQNKMQGNHMSLFHFYLYLNRDVSRKEEFIMSGSVNCQCQTMC